MNRKLMIKILELLEETYPQCYHVGRLTKKLGVSEDGEFSKVIRYLRATSKIIATERLYLSDEITIVPKGIDFLTELKLLEARENISQQQIKFTELLALATMILGITAFFQLTQFGFPIDSNNVLGLIIVGFLSVILLTLIIFLIIDSIRYIFRKYPFRKL